MPAAEIVRTHRRRDAARAGRPELHAARWRERWRYRDGDGRDRRDRLGDPAVLQHCTRARLSAEGKLYTCLFGVKGHDFRDLLRGGASDEELREALAGIWARRGDRYSEQRTSLTAPVRRIEMSYIGG